VSKRNIYFILAILGLLLPYGLFLPWLVEHGFNVQLFFSEMFANDVAGTTALDFLMVTIVVNVFIVSESKRIGMKNIYIPVIASLLAIGFGLAVFLCMRERFFEKDLKNE